MNSFMTRAILRESGSERPDFRHQIALREAEKAYFQTLALLEAEEAEQPSRTKRALKTGAKVAAGAGAAYLGAAGGMGLSRAYKHGLLTADMKGLKTGARYAAGYIKRPKATFNRFAEMVKKYKQSRGAPVSGNSGMGGMYD